MKYSRVIIESFGYQLAPVVVSTSDLETRLEPLYHQLEFELRLYLTHLEGGGERLWDAAA